MFDIVDKIWQFLSLDPFCCLYFFSIQCGGHITPEIWLEYITYPIKSGRGTLCIQ